jgi:hypothetical protein
MMQGMMQGRAGGKRKNHEELQHEKSRHHCFCNPAKTKKHKVFCG